MQKCMTIFYYGGEHIMIEYNNYWSSSLTNTQKYYNIVFEEKLTFQWSDILICVYR